MPKTILSFPDLFHDVQMVGVFADSKTFPDCEPKADLDEIYSSYLEHKNSPEFNLKAFVNQHFEVPQTEPQGFVFDASASPREHIEKLWPYLLKSKNKVPLQSTYLPLPNPFIVPGGRFQEVYYWDSYFTMLGLQRSGHYDWIRGMVENFAHLIQTYGFIPNGNRSYFLSRSQPPFFAMMVELLMDEEGPGVFEEFLPSMLKEYDFWMRGGEDLQANQAQSRVVCMPDGELLNRYWDDCPEPRPESYREDVELAEKSAQPATELYRNIRAACESGWDFSTRWFADPNDFSTIQTTKLVPIELNCLLHRLEERIAQGAEKIDPVLSKQFKKKSQNRFAAIRKYCWNKSKNFFFDYNWTTQCQSEAVTIAGCFPMMFDMVTFRESVRVAEVVESKFLAEGGVLTTLNESGQQWDAPNGWAPLQFLAFLSVGNHCSAALASEISDRWVALNKRVFEATGKFTEKYNVKGNQTETGGGEYPNQDGFGWTNGVFLYFLPSDTIA